MTYADYRHLTFDRRPKGVLLMALDRSGGPIFDNSLALEMLAFAHPDVREGVRAIREKRSPQFPSAT